MIFFRGEYLKKILLLVSICSIMIPSLLSQSLSAFENPKIQQMDDIDVRIYAGVYEKTRGRMGLGFAISISNNLNETINGTVTISSDNLRGQNVRLEIWDFNLSAHHPPVILNGIDWIHSPYPIITLTITVEAVSVVVSRSGIEIGPFVIFEPNYNF